MFTIEDIEIDGYNGPAGRGNYSFSHLTMKGDPTFPSVFRDFEIEDFLQDENAMPEIRYHRRLLSIRRSGDGKLGFPEYTKYLEDYVDPIDGDAPCFTFVPAESFDPLVVFCFQYADDTFDCTIMRYSEAAS